jgi:hypothetical protein
MSITLRRLIAFGLILIFIILAPLLILYTAGYRYNYKKNQLQKTGALVLKSEPSGAQIFIDSKPIGAKTPARLNNVLPDEHEISLQKAGYYSWNKKLNVKEQETTFAESVILFKKSNPELVYEQKIISLNFSPDNRYAALTVNESGRDYLYLLNLSNQKIRLLGNRSELSGKPKISWSKNNNWILWQAGSIAKIISAFLPKQEKTLPPASLDASIIKWSDSDDIFFLAASQIYQFNALTGNVEKIFTLAPTEKILDFLIADKTIFLVSKIKDKFFLSRYSLVPAENFIPKAVELNSAQFSFDGIYYEKLALRDKKNNGFYLFNLDLNKILFKKSDIIDVEYLENKKTFLLGTSQELGTLALDSEPLEETNITRYSDGLQAAKWHRLANYVFALRNGAIDIIELDDRNGHFTLSLPFSDIINFGLDAKSENLFFLQDNYLQQLQIK